MASARSFEQMMPARAVTVPRGVPTNVKTCRAGVTEWMPGPRRNHQLLGERKRPVPSPETMKTGAVVGEISENRVKT